MYKPVSTVADLVAPVAVSPLIPGSVSVNVNSAVLGNSTPIVSPSYV